MDYIKRELERKFLAMNQVLAQKAPELFEHIKMTKVNFKYI